MGVRSKVGEGSTFWVELRESLRGIHHSTSNIYSHNTALGVGPKAMVPPGPLELLPEGHIPTDPAAMQKADSTIPTSGNIMEDADAAAFLRASQVHPASTRSSAALHSLMEQGPWAAFH